MGKIQRFRTGAGGKIGYYMDYVPVIGNILGGMDWVVDAVVIKERAGGGHKIKTDKASRIVDSDGKEKYVLRSENVVTAAVEYSNLYSKEDGGDLVFIHSPEAGMYQPIKADLDISEDILDFTAGEADWMRWAEQGIKEEIDAWQEPGTGIAAWLRENPGMAVLMFGGFFFMLYGVGLWFALKDFTGTINAAVSTLQPLVDQANQLG